MHLPTTTFEDVGPLLSPRSVAIIGASDSPGNLGGIAVEFCKRFGYPGGIFPINPGRDNVGGLRCYHRLMDLPEVPDLAIIATGEDSVCDVVRDCAAAGIRYGIVWAGGFAEVGEEGIARQNALIEICQNTGFRVLGPNCLGAINGALPMTATFASFLIESDKLLNGSIAMVGQSGGLVSMCTAFARKLGVGLRYMVSTGNEAVLSTADFIHAFTKDPDTKVIAVYIEGVRDGAKFVAALAAARRAGKPVVLMKGGVTAASARAAAAHTGALAGEGRVWDAILSEQAVIQVQSVEEFLDVTLYLNSIDLNKLPKGNGVAAIAFGGGFGVLAADQCARQGLATLPLSDTSRESLRPLLPPIASTVNPFDLTPMTYNQTAWMERLPAALDVIAQDSSVDTIFFQNGAMSRHGPELADIIREIRDRSPKPVCLAWPLAPASVIEKARADGFYVFIEYARAINAIAKLTQYQVNLSRAREPADTDASPFDWVAHVRNPTDGAVISEHECHRILKAAGLPTANGAFAVNADEAVAAACQIGFPVVMKGISPEVTHRAKAGLVALDIRAEDELRTAHSKFDARAASLGVHLEGVYIQKMASGGQEILVSAFRDPIFGIMVSCGAGGVLTEIIDDVVLARAPLDEDTARDMLERLRIVRPASKMDIAPLAAFVAAFSQLAACAPWRDFTLEVNPVRWTADGVVAIDSLLLIGTP